MQQEARIHALLGRHGCRPDAAHALAVLLERLAAPTAPTSVHDPAKGLDVHIADSLSGLEVEELARAHAIADLGAGAGLPGLVLAAVLPDSRVTLVESVGRKAAFAHETAAAMGLANVELIHARVEEWGAGAGACDAVCARALATLPVLCEYAAPLLREGGVLVAWKGVVGDDEARDGTAAATHLGLAADPPRLVVPFSGSERRTLHVLRKIAHTPAGYPRRPGIATKRPLSATNLR